MSLSRWFKKSEFECKCGCGEEFEIDPNLIYVLGEIREYVGHPLYISSGYRCKKHNKAVGSTEKSQHRKGKAADIYFEYHKPKQVADIAEDVLDGRGGLGRYETFTHVDVRKVKARWGKN